MKQESAKLNKIAGQVSGLSMMIEQDRDCEKIIIQFQAAKAALDGVFSDFLHQNLNQCLRESKSKKIKKILKQITKQ